MLAPRVNATENTRLWRREGYFRNQMNSDSAIAHLERAGIERGIRKCDYLLEMISEEHVRFLVDLNECNLIRHLLASRRTCPRTYFRSAATLRHRGGTARPN
jgi:hypothetical protein